MQDTKWIIQTLEFKFRKILKVLGIVVWEQVLEGWDQLDDRDLRPLFLQNNHRRIYKRLEVMCDHDVLTSRLVYEMGDGRS